MLQIQRFMKENFAVQGLSYNFQNFDPNVLSSTPLRENDNSDGHQNYKGCSYYLWQ